MAIFRVLTYLFILMLNHVKTHFHWEKLEEKKNVKTEEKKNFKCKEDVREEVLELDM